MTDSETRLRDLLDRAAPGSPALDPAARTAAVVQRGRAARRRDRGLVAGAAAAVLALAVGVPLALGGDDGPTEVASPPAITAAPCPAEPIDVTGGSAVADLGDVVSVRSCPATWEQADGLPGDPDPLPTQPLTGDAAAGFAEDVLAMPPYELPNLCAAVNVAPSPWALVVESAGGGTSVVGSTMRLCSSVEIAGSPRGVDHLIAAFTGNLDRQQSGDPKPGSDGPACPQGDPPVIADAWNASFDISSATRGMVCYVPDPMGSVEYAATEGELDLDTLATIRDDLSERVSSASHDFAQCTDTGPTRVLVLTNDAGDRVSYVDNRCTGEFQGALGYWQPSPEAEAAISEALGGPAER